MIIRRHGVIGSVSAFQSGAAALIRFLAGSGILISILGLSVCPSSVFSLAVALKSCLLFWTTVNDSSYRYLTHGCKYRGV